MAGPRLSWAHRRFCAIDGRAVAHSPCFPLGGCLSTFLSVMPPVMRLHLIGAVFCDGRGQIGLTLRRSCAFDGRACSGLFFLLPFPVASFSPVRFRVNIHVRSLCRAAGVLESQESGGRARASCSQRCWRQAEFEALGSGDAMVATSCAPSPTWLGLALLLLDAASAPLLSACAALQYRRCSPAASATRRLDQVPVEPGTSATSFTTVLLGRTPTSFSLAQGGHRRGLFRRGRASTAARPPFLRPRPERLPGGFRASHSGRPLQLHARSRRRRSPWSQPPRRRVGWSFSIAGASSRRFRLPRSIGC